MCTKRAIRCLQVLSKDWHQEEQQSLARTEHERERSLLLSLFAAMSLSSPPSLCLHSVVQRRNGSSSQQGITGTKYCAIKGWNTREKQNLHLQIICLHPKLPFASLLVIADAPPLSLPSSHIPRHFSFSFLLVVSLFCPSRASLIYTEMVKSSLQHKIPMPKLSPFKLGCPSKNFR